MLSWRYLSEKTIFLKIFNSDMMIRTQPTTLLQIFLEIMLHSRFLFKYSLSPDEFSKIAVSTIMTSQRETIRRRSDVQRSTNNSPSNIPARLSRISKYLSKITRRQFSKRTKSMIMTSGGQRRVANPCS